MERKKLLKKRSGYCLKSQQDFTFKIREGEVGILLSFQPILVIKFKFNNFKMILDFN